VTGWGSVLNFRQGDVGDDKTGVSISFAVAFVMLVVRPGDTGALGEDEPVFIVIVCSSPVELYCLLVACRRPLFSLPPPLDWTPATKGE